MNLLFVLLLATVSTLSLAAEERSVMIEFTRVPNPTELVQIQREFALMRIERFDSYPSDYFSRLYRARCETVECPQGLGARLERHPLIQRVEAVNAIDLNSIEITQDHSPLSNDLYASYQWPLHWNGQSLLKDINDIQSERITGHPQADLNFLSVASQLDQLIKRDVVVALVDSGVDLDHPDLKKQIYRNQVECEGDQLPLDPTQDKDGNGYIGDCMGWNFVSANKPAGDHRPYDDVGHGTHLAGIIAAEINNQSGIRGISAKIKILPIKVLDKVENGNRRLSTGTLTDRIAKGILYAIKMRADVINLSMGWPLAMDTNYLREAIREAIKQGVTVVAAAGNNHNNELIFPCAYQNVICVAASTVDGSLAHFSNFGAHVDLLSPGDNILSTYPTTLMPEFFSMTGYEIKNGTSQAAPYVASLAALLRGRFPDLTPEHLYAQLAGFARPPQLTMTPLSSTTTDTLHGLVDFGGSLGSLFNSELVVPMIKESNEVLIKNQAGEFDLEIPLKNVGTLTSNSAIVEVAITSANAPLLSLTNTRWTIPSLAPAQTIQLKIPGQIRSRQADNRLTVNIALITNNNQKRHFQATFYFVMTSTALMPTIFPINASPEMAKRLGVSRGNEVRTQLASVADPHQQLAYPEFYLLNSSETAGIELTIFRADPITQRYQPLASTLTIPAAQKFVSIQVMDFNFDRRPDYFITSTAEKEVPNSTKKEKFILYSFFNLDGSPLYPAGRHHVKFIPESAVLNLRSFHLLPYELRGVGKIALPLFISEGKIPSADLNPDPWVTNPTHEMPHLYYLMPVEDTATGTLKFTTRIIDNYRWDEALKNQLRLRGDESINFLTLVPQTANDIQMGRSQALISVGKNYQKSFFVLNVTRDGRLQLQKIDRTPFQWDGTMAFSSIDLEHAQLAKTGLSLVGLESVTDLKISNLQQGSTGPIPFNHKIYQQPDKRDHILTYMTSFHNEETFYNFFQTKSTLKLLISQSDQRPPRVLSKDIARFSFLPGNLFTESFFPIVINQRPALYVDATQLNRKDLYVMTLDSSETNLSSPIALNLKLMPSCQSLNPARPNALKHYFFTLICLKDQVWSIHFYPME